jgi:hypothetical protein
VAKRLDPAFLVGRGVADRFIEHTRHDMLNREQRALLAFIVADALRNDRRRARNKYKRKSA